MKFVQHNGAIVLRPEIVPNYTDLAAGVYQLRASMELGLYLEQVDMFTMPPKMYGDTTQRAQRVLNTFRDRPSVTGVLLSGDKGSGKTLLAKEVCRQGIAQGIPVILVNSSYAGDSFSKFVQDIHQPVIFFFDEFEKTHDEKEQSNLLTLLDGTMSSKKLFLLTINSIGKISEFMTNRPGRLFYNFQYAGLDNAFVKEYAEDALKDKSEKNVADVVTAGILAGQFNFDQLSALVQEMNRYGETAAQAVKFLNITPRHMTAKYNVSARLNNYALSVPYYSQSIKFSPSQTARDYLNIPVQVRLPLTAEERKAGNTADDRIVSLGTFAFSDRERTEADLLNGLYRYTAKIEESDLDEEIWERLVAAAGSAPETIEVALLRDAPAQPETMSSLLS